MTHPPDDLVQLLQPVPGSSVSAVDRDVLLRSTTRVLRRRVWLRRSVVAAGVLAVFALGFGSAWILKPVPEREVVFVPKVEPPQDVTPVEPRGPSAGQLEVKAELSDDRAEVARLYREAGDKYLTDEKDYAQAARCYQLFLQAADEEAKKVSVSDSWLLLTLKVPNP